MKWLLKGIMVISLSLGLIFGTIGSNVQAATETKYMNLNTTVKSMNSIQLSWKKKNVEKYHLYRAESDKDGNEGKYKKIATLSSKKTSYLDQRLKQEKTYYYKIRGYDKKGNRKYYGGSQNYTGLFCNFDEYQIPDAKHSTKEIELKMCSNGGMKPDGYKIYRKTKGDKKYKLLKDVKKKSWYITYMDKTVEAGKIYFYKIKTYKTIGKKKYYSKYSQSVKMIATNQTGIFRAQFMEDKDRAEDEAVFLITSENGNGEIKIRSGIFTSLYLQKQDGSEIDSSVDIIGYSRDGKEWIAVEKGKETVLTLRANETVWMRIKSFANEKICTRDGLEKFKLFMDVTYNDLFCTLDLDLLSEYGIASVLEEAYH